MKNKILAYLTIVCTACFLFTACGGSNNEADNDDQTAIDSTAVSDNTTSEITLSDMSDSPDFPVASLRMEYKNGKFVYLIDSKDYKLGAQTSDAPQKMCANSEKGQHIHLIIDNEPYDALYETTFEKQVPDGEHYILSFLSRSYHESIKSPSAQFLVKGTVANNTLTKSDPVREPMLFYSRPKGNYVGNSETDKIMLDFYLANVTLSPDGYKVKALINGEKEFILTEWKPYLIEGLPMGDNKIKLTLIDKDGNPVSTPLNPVERVFTLVDDPAPGQ